jgi:hypothetical protein
LPVVFPPFIEQLPRKNALKLPGWEMSIHSDLRPSLRQDLLGNFPGVPAYAFSHDFRLLVLVANVQNTTTLEDASYLLHSLTSLI